MGRILFWSPRALAILFALFISTFALDVFSEGRGLRPTMLALLIHLIPTGVLLIALLLAWRWEWMGAILYTAFAAFYIASFGGRFPWFTYLIVAGPLIAIAVLFLTDWLYRRRLMQP